MDLSHISPQYDPNAHVSGDEQTDLMELADPGFEEYVAFGSDVYKSALLGADNSTPKNNRLVPTLSEYVYENPVNWHPCTIGVNAGTRINNVRVNYNGGLNVFWKFTGQ